MTHFTEVDLRRMQGQGKARMEMRFRRSQRTASATAQSIPQAGVPDFFGDSPSREPARVSSSKVFSSKQTFEFNLTNLPREIRERVYFFILSNRNIEVSYEVLGAYEWNIEGNRHNMIAPEFGALKKVKYDSLPWSSRPCHNLNIQLQPCELPNCFNILLTSRQVSNEATEVLYGNSPFVLSGDQADAFRTKFIPFIGSLNTSYIKKICMNMPDSIKRNTTMISREYINLFNKMPKLTELVIGTHFYAHSHQVRLAHEYSSMLQFAAAVAVSHSRLASATFLDMGLQEALRMRNDPTLSAAEILNAQVEIKIRITARTTQEELAHLLKDGGMMLDAKKISTVSENTLYKCWDPKDWAIDCGEAVNVMTTLPQVGADVIAAAEKEEMGRAAKTVLSKEEAEAQKIMKFKTDLGRAGGVTIGAGLPSTSPYGSKGLCGDQIMTSFPSYGNLPPAMPIVGSASTFYPYAPLFQPGGSGCTTPLTPDMYAIAQVAGLSQDEIAAQTELFKNFNLIDANQREEDDMRKAIAASLASLDDDGKANDDTTDHRKHLKGLNIGFKDDDMMMIPSKMATTTFDGGGGGVGGDEILPVSAEDNEDNSFLPDRQAAASRSLRPRDPKLLKRIAEQSGGRNAGRKRMRFYYPGTITDQTTGHTVEAYHTLEQDTTEANAPAGGRKNASATRTSFRYEEDGGESAGI